MIVTPTSDPIIQVLVAAPMCVLFEIAILAARRVERGRERSGAAVLFALLALLPKRRVAVGKLAWQRAT
jgi:Sec-independent protein secretion pathway component TatC